MVAARVPFPLPVPSQDGDKPAQEPGKVPRHRSGPVLCPSPCAPNLLLGLLWCVGCVVFNSLLKCFEKAKTKKGSYGFRGLFFTRTCKNLIVFSHILQKHCDALRAWSPTKPTSPNGRFHSCAS